MDDDDRPRSRGSEKDYGAASLLAGESLDSYSLDELDARISLLEAEIARVASHRMKAAAHMDAADALFRPKGG
ncbi:hypothetical protein GCM10011371_15640 [Novosphingobium marinum]|uniref:Uncharacterized small protein (DUF1192 family) n=1 Tax=Novosphingobium marinum TaxID=1514948 RepID=A0A7Y9XYM3_9SPHN|nr:DUF1192 domain-containing protein [Novosphingobium marinum]NYH95678.1 uncharacterized small protein (DUF1192 family) [Novosphingobium marinum]GGC28968.1 hypothetical protein GCM10011371_15640 [Novosphingobium marinum]